MLPHPKVSKRVTKNNILVKETKMQVDRLKDFIYMYLSFQFKNITNLSMKFNKIIRDLS